jgi:hypothetical protein
LEFYCDTIYLSKPTSQSRGYCWVFQEFLFYDIIYTYKNINFKYMAKGNFSQRKEKKKPKQEKAK